MEKKRKFNQLRAQHYNMKAVLAHSKELLENEELEPKFSDPDFYDVNDSSSQADDDEDDSS